MNHSRWRTTEQLFFILAFVLLNAVSVFAGPSRTTYQAKIVKPDGYPLEATSVNFKFTILDPAGSCILYSETYSAVNMSATGGLISFALGSGVKTYPVSATNFEQVFSNVTPSLSCDAGGPTTYSPSSSDTRKIVMQFHDGSGWQTLPAMSINAVPYAMYANEAQKLNGKADSDFVQVSTLATCGASEALRYNGASFSCVAIDTGAGVTSGTIVTALGYTPADGASMTALSSSLATTNSNVSSVSSTIFSVSSTVTNLNTTVASLSNSVAASFAAMTSSQWSTSGTNIFYEGGKVGIGTNNPIDILQVESSGTTVLGVNTTGSGTSARAIVAFDRAGLQQWDMGVNTNQAGTNDFYFRRTQSSNYLMTLTSSGSVGIGTIAPVTKLDVAGGLRISMESASCAVSYAGTLRYNSGTVEYCNGTSWMPFGVAGAGITNFNGSTSGTQSFATGVGGTAPNFVTSNGVHTLNIPLASTGAVTAGLLSNADYTAFSNKITSSAASIVQVLGYVPADNSVSGTYAQKANNLSDLTNVVTARANLGLGPFATASTIDLGGASATGTLAIARLPSFTGDATIAAASNTIVLANSGVTAGTYTKVTVDAKGRVISGAQLAASDVNTALGYTPAASGSLTSSQWVSSATTIYYNGGNVGVGTAAPAARLDVNGDAHFANLNFYENLVVVPTATYVPVNLNSASSTLTAGNVYRVQLVVVGTATPTGAVYNVYQTGPTTWTATVVSYNGASSNHPLLRVNAAGNGLEVYHNHASSYSIRTAINTINTGNVTVVAPTFFGLENAMTNYAGNIGLGTSAPTALLHVARSAGTTIAQTSSNTANAGLLIEGGAGGVLAFDGNEIQQFGDTLFLRGENGINLSAGDSADGDSITPMVMTRTGRIGFGTTNPVVANHFSKGTTMGGVGSLNLNNSIVRIQESASTTLNFDGNTIAAEEDLFIGTKGSGSFQLFSSDTVRVAIGNTGNVGIGVGVASAKLQISSGTTSLAPLKFTSGTLTTAAQAGAVEYDGANLYFTDGTNTRRILTAGSGAGSIDNASTINATGNITMVPVGSVVVSSTTPSTNSQTGALIVKGGIGVAGDIYASGSIVTSQDIQGSEITATSATITPYVYGSTASGGSLRLESTTHANKGNVLLASGGGNVGVNISNPSSPLHVQGSAANSTVPWMTLEGGGGALDNIALRLFDRGTAANNNNSIEFMHMGPSINGVATARVRSLNASTFASGGSSLFLETASDASGTWNNSQLVLNRNGYVGIGTSAPTSKLQVYDGTVNIQMDPTNKNRVGITSQNDINSYVQMEMRPSNDAGTLFGQTLANVAYLRTATASGLIVGNATDVPVMFGNNNLERMRIAAGGNVGIGTTTPSYVLDVSGTINAMSTNADAASVSSSALRMNFRAFDGSSDFGGIGLLNSGANRSDTAVFYGDDINESLRFVNVRSASPNYNLLENMRLTADGKLGLGTNSPSYLMDLYGAASPTLRIRSASNDGASGPTIRLTEDLAENGGFVRYHSLNNSLDLGVVESAVERTALSIDRSTGKIGVGVVAPTARFQLMAGTSSTAPLKLTAGTLLTAPQAGSVEYDGTDFYVTDNAGMRRTVATATTAGTLDNVTVVSSPSGIALWPAAGNSVTVSATTASTNSSTGALIVKGGLGVAGNIYSSGTIITSSDIQGSDITATSSVITPYVYGSTASGGALRLESTTHANKGNVLIATGSTSSKVGIGTASPSEKLHVNGNIYSNMGEGFRILGDTNYFGNNMDGIIFEMQDGNSTAGATDGGFVFRGYTPTDSLAKEWMVIKTPGYVGLGTSAPNTNLEIAESKNGDTTINIANSNTGTSTRSGLTLTNSGTSYGSDSAGLFLLGVSHTSGEKIQLFSNSGIASGIEIAASASTAPVVFSTQALERMRVTNSGNIGIGVTNPAGKLGIVSGGQVFNFATGGNTSGYTLNVGLNDDGVNFDTNSTVRGYNFKNGNGALVAITADGRLGIDTTAPTAKLDVRNDTLGSALNDVVEMQRLAGSLGGNTSDLDIRHIRTAAGSTWNDAGTRIQQKIDATWMAYMQFNGSGNDGGVAFGTGQTTTAPGNVTERMRITQAGNVGIANASPGYTLDVGGVVNIAAASSLRFGGTIVCTSTGCTASSDKRLKENIQPLDFSLEKLLSLNAVQYDWKDKEKFGKQHEIGFIAQDLEKVYPEVVRTDKDSGFKSVSYDKLVAPIIEALKVFNARMMKLFDRTEQHAREIASVKQENAELKARVEKTEKENEELKKRLDRIEKALTNSNSK